MDETTRLVTELVLKNADTHDSGLDRSIGKIRDYGAASSSAFGSAGTSVDSFVDKSARLSPMLDAAGAGIRRFSDVANGSFRTLGIESSRELQATASNAQRAFDTIKNSGTSSISDISRAWDAKQDIVDRTVGSWTASFSRGADHMASIGQRMTTAVTLPLLAIGGASIKMASDFEESANKSKVVFGNSAKVIEDFAKDSAISLGLSSQKAIESSATFGNLFKTMGVGTPVAADMSVKMVKLASDLASFHNIRPEDALEKLRSGLVGEAEPMRTLGVLLSENTVKLKAAELGYKAVGGQLTEQQKVMARYAIILEQTKTAQGDFSRTSDGVANSSRTVTAQFQDLGAGIGKELLPLAKELGGNLKGLLGWFNDLSPSAKSTAVDIAGIAAVAGPTAFAVGKLVGGVADATRVTKKFIEVAPGVINSLKGIELATLAARAGWLALAAGAVYAMAKIAEGQKNASFQSSAPGAGIIGIQAGGVGQNRVQRGVLDWLLGKAGLLQREIVVETPEAALNWSASSTKLEEGMEKLGKAGAGLSKKHGAGMGKALLDGFKEGSAGYNDALKTVLAAPDLSKLFDPLSKSAKKGGEQLKAALKTVADGINDYFQSFGAGITVTPERLTGFSRSVIENLGLASSALKQAREDQANQLIGINANFKAHHLGLKAILEDGVIVIRQTGKDAVDAIKENSERAALADSLQKGFTANNSDLQVTLNARNQILVTSGKVAVESARGVASGLTAALGTKLTADLKLAVDAQGDKLGDAFVSMWENVRKEQGVGAAETARLATEAFNKLTPDIQRVVKPAFDQLIFQLGRPKAALEDLKLALDRDPIYVSLKTKLDVRSTIDSVISDFERMGVQLGKTGQDLDKYVADGVRGLDTFKKANQADVEAAIEAHKRAANKLPGIWEDVFHDLDSNTRRDMNSVFAVIDSMPGRWGDNLRKTRSEFESWLKFLDSSTRLIQRILGEQETGIRGIFNSTIGIFKQSTAAAIDFTKMSQQEIQKTAKAASQGAGATSSATGAIATAATVNASKFKVAFSAMEGALASFSTAVAVTAGTGSKTMGFLSSLVSSTLAGVQAGLAFGPVAGAVVGGISLVGGLLGALFGGKSAAQKEQERLALEKQRNETKISQQHYLQEQEATKQSWISTLDRGRALLESIAFYTKVPKDSFKAFFKDMYKMMDEYVKQSKLFNVDALKKAAEVAKEQEPIINTVGATPAAFTAINGHWGLAESQFEIFFRDYDRLIDGMVAQAESMTKKQARKTGKIADLLSPAVNIISPLVEGIKGLKDLEEPTDASIAVIEHTLDRITLRLGALGEKFEKQYLKELGFFSEKAQPALDVFKGTIEAIRASVDVPQLKEQDADNVVGGLELFMNKLTARLGPLQTDGLDKVAALSSTVITVSGAIKAWGESTNVIRGYTSIAANTWDDIQTDWDHGQEMLDMLLDGALLDLDKATKFESTVLSMSSHLENGIKAYVSAITNTASALNGLNSLQGGAQSNAASGQSFGAMSAGGNFGAQSFAQPSGFTAPPVAPVAPGGHTSQPSNTPIVITIEHHGDIYLGEEPAPERTKQTFRKLWKEAYNEELQEELHRLRSQH